MAVYTTPTESPHEHYIERDTRGSSAGLWAVVAVLIVLFAILFFGTNLFGRRGGNSTNINVETPGSSTTNPSGSGSGSVGQ